MNIHILDFLVKFPPETAGYDQHEANSDCHDKDAGDEDDHHMVYFLLEFCLEFLLCLMVVLLFFSV